MKPSAYRQAELDYFEERPIKVVCGFCDWATEGTFKECKQEAREHRAESHPELVRKRKGFRPGYGLGTWGAR